jgi:hypothetical protein
MAPTARTKRAEARIWLYAATFLLDPDFGTLVGSVEFELAIDVLPLLLDEYARLVCFRAESVYVHMAATKLLVTMEYSGKGGMTADKKRRNE